MRLFEVFCLFELILCLSVDVLHLFIIIVRLSEVILRLYDIGMRPFEVVWNLTDFFFNKKCHKNVTSYRKSGPRGPRPVLGKALQ